ncbi:methyltransferase domain-containing protein [Geoglobus acetivorans]|uniref:Class I SAM-dependent methyltransferase n=1 Tax=Geoglobus acetivorans TaxID=565033 RepID=A0ABZ3H1L6_GEOAI
MRKSFFSETVREKALSVAGVEKGRTAADIGAGTGFITEGLVRKGLRVIAVDRSEVMLAEMKKKFGGFQVDYCVGDAEKLPIPDEAVDYVFANMCLHHVESPPKAIKEMVRILKSGGRLVVTDLDEHSFEFLREEHHDRWMGFRREDIERWFREAGLGNVSVECAGEDCCAQSCCGEYARVSIFVASGEK